MKKFGISSVCPQESCLYGVLFIVGMMHYYSSSTISAIDKLQNNLRLLHKLNYYDVYLLMVFNGAGIHWKMYSPGEWYSLEGGNNLQIGNH